MKLKDCPKFGYTRQDSDTAPEYECPACGVVYAKYVALQAAQRRAAVEAEEVAHEAERKKRAEEERAAELAAAAHNAQLTACRSCGGVVAWEAKSCPHCGQRKPAGKRPPQPASKMAIAGAAGLIIFMIWAMAQRDTAPNDVNAWTVCQAAAKIALKATSSASFDNGSIKVSKTQQGFNVIGIVHAENSFGAKLRTEYECEIRRAAGGLSVEHLGIDGRLIY